MGFLTYAVPITVYIVGFLFEIAYTEKSNLGIQERERFRKKMNISIGILIFLIAALRGPGTGMDTGQYYRMFKDVLAEELPLSYYWSQLITSISGGTFRDMYFWEFFMKLASYVIRSAQGWLAFVSFLYLLSVYIIIDKYSADPAISWLYIYYVFIFSFILQGLRQSMAMACIMFSFRYIMERNWKGFILLITLATLFHQSAMIFFLAYPISMLKNPKGYIITIIVAILCQVVPSVALGIIGKLAVNTRFAGYTSHISGLSWSSFFIQLAIFAFCYYYRTKDDEKDELITILLNFSVMGILMQSMTVIVAEMFRVSYYFNMFNMLLLANICKSIGDEKYNQSYRIAIITLLFAYNFVSGAYRYWFFWQ
ncbi:MAG: EpsG family protein [Clostridia bacterium]|nr:EpsG family protein [Clostridia bacterium]